MNRNNTFSRRQFVAGAVTAAAGSALLSRVTSKAEQLALADVPTNSATSSDAGKHTDQRYRRVITPNGSTLPWKIVGGVKICFFDVCSGYQP